MERGEVQRDVRPKMGQDPLGELARLGRIIVQGGDHQSGDLKPHMRLVLEPLQRLENGRKMGQRYLAVEVLRKRLQVDIRSIDVVINVVKGFAGDVAV